MGTDISGFVECRAWRADEGERDLVWRAAADLFLLNDTRNYDAFGCLFGVRNFANFRPLAAERGRPVDASEEVRAELDRLAPWPDQAYGTTWITWAELEAVDWDEPAERPDSRIHQYRQTPDGLRLVGKSGWSPEFARAVGLQQQLSGRGRPGPRERNGSSATPSTGPKRSAAGTRSGRTASGSRSGTRWKRSQRSMATITCDWSSGSTTDRQQELVQVVAKLKQIICMKGLRYSTHVVDRPRTGC